MQFRNATTDDIDQCIELLRNDQGFQAEPALWEALPRLWKEHIEQQVFAGFQVFEKKQRHTTPIICGFRISAFVKPAFSFSYAAHPYPQVAAEIWRQVLAGKSPLLNRDEIALANARGELRLAVLHSPLQKRDPTDVDTAQLLALLPLAWQYAHFGYRLKDLPVFEVFGSAASVVVQNAGYKQYKFANQETNAQEICTPRSHVFCWNTATQSSETGSFITHAMTHCPPPNFHFTPAQQRLLSSALDGRSDKEIAEIFGIRYDTVRQSWDSIFQRVDSVNEAILPNPVKRGGERRRALIEYVRQHLEEIRPYDKRASDNPDPQSPYLQMLSSLPD